MKLASFDIELSKPISDTNLNPDLKSASISCAAIAFSDKKDIALYTGEPELDISQSQSLVADLERLQKDGYGIVTWNGCSFDLQVLAHSSDKLKECAQLALSHYDLMMYITFQKGWYLSLDKALQGANLQGKLKEVHLSDGSILKDMSGSKAPELWMQGEKEVVINYLKQDVTQQLQLGQWVAKNKKICWTSNSGKPWSLSVPKLHTVEECFDFPTPDVSWMDNPPKRSKFVDWIPPNLRP